MWGSGLEPRGWAVLILPRLARKPLRFGAFGSLQGFIEHAVPEALVRCVGMQYKKVGRSFCLHKAVGVPVGGAALRRFALCLALRALVLQLSRIQPFS